MKIKKLWRNGSCVIVPVTNDETRWISVTVTMTIRILQQQPFHLYVTQSGAAGSQED